MVYPAMSRNVKFDVCISRIRRDDGLRQSVCKEFGAVSKQSLPMMSSNDVLFSSFPWSMNILSNHSSQETVN